MHPATVLQANLLGLPTIQRDATPLVIPRLQTRALFYRLAVHLQPVARDHLCFLFWPDTPDDVARRNLTLLLSHLRRALPTPDLVLTDTEQVQLDTERVTSDSAPFARLCAATDDGTRLARLEQAVALYRGPLLAGFVAPDGCPEYDLWLAGERRMFERMYLDALTALTEACTARGRTDEAIRHARRYLELDDLAEDMHRQLMRLYAMMGDRGAARRQFEACAAILEQELGVSPLPETHALYQSILDGQMAAPQPVAPEPVWATLPGPAVPLVGREDTRQRLRQAYEQAADGQGNVVLLVGDAGIGKSRLVQEFVGNLPGPVSIFTAASHPGVQFIPYQPIVEALRPALQVPANLSVVDTGWLSVASMLFPEIRGQNPQLPIPVWPEPEQARGQLFEALCQLLWAWASRSVVLLCLDDLHWADSTTLDWLSYLARDLRHRRLLVLGAYRSEEAYSLSPLRDRLRRLHVLTEIPLSPLDVAGVHQVLAHVYPQSADTGTLAAGLQRFTGGNPFFLLESIQAFRETGASFTTLDREASLPLSANVRTAIVQRMERLSPVARQTLEAGAVLGLEFDFDLVRQTAGRQEIEIGEGLDELATRRFIEEHAGRYRFCHELVQSAVYQALSGWRRQLLHRRAAEALARRHLNPDDPANGQIAEHYARGDKAQEALAYYRRAADAAERLYATQEAAQYLNKALMLLQGLPASTERHRQELALLIVLGSALMAVKGFAAPEIRDTYTRALALCEQVGSDAQRFHALWGIYLYHQVRGEYASALRFANATLSMVETRPYPTLLPYAYCNLGATMNQQGEFARGQGYLEQVTAHYDPGQQHPFAIHIRPDYGVLARGLLAHIRWHLGYPEQALSHVRQALSLAEQSAHPFDQIVALDYAAMLHQFRGETALVRTMAQAALAHGVAYEYAYYRAWAVILLGWVLVETGDAQTGVAQMRQGLADFDQTGAGIRKPYYLGLLAEALGKAGQPQAGLAQLDAALALTAQRGEGWRVAELHRLRGELLLAQGATMDEAGQQFEQALAVARQRQAKALELRAALSLGRVWQQQGRREPARRLLDGIMGRFTEGFDTPDWQEATHLLRELSL